MRLPDELVFINNARLPQKTTDARLDGRICIIAGATSGVGYEAARRLAQGGATVVMVCRNPEKAARVSPLRRNCSTICSRSAAVARRCRRVIA